MLMTAAGTIPPAQVLVLGAGVAGLQAIATARRLGAVVTAFDVRAAVKEQVLSLGAASSRSPARRTPRRRAVTRASSRRRSSRRSAMRSRRRSRSRTSVITTALVPGRPAPKLITAAAAQAMKPGSVIVDLAGEAGGNCELTRPGETYTTDEGVIIAAPLNLPSAMAEHASQLYARNVSSLLELMTGEDGALALDFEDAVIAGACITRGGEIVHEGARKAAG